ncbi:hypothetical protein SDC9_170405 [bioreactor metagenome]|uniref:Uncharacterized protein n=1 Tax=bioreactor metagenome TaxID=1076179 RepID=A0A645GAF6_9ZZZZ
MQKKFNKLCCKKWKELTTFMLHRAAQFSVLDWAIFKTCLVSLGLMIGTWFARLFKKLAPLVALIFIVSWVYLVWRIFFDEEFE